jgi:lipopolysaccharide/colanic/teichoic acid biosynthesis glycosyltransferase
MSSEPVLIGISAQSPELEIATWCHSAGKRIFDLTCGVPVLLAVSPLMLIVAAVVRFTSKGPVLFRQNRMGRDGREFEFLKFRTMTHGAIGPGITSRGDSRITKVGRLLRKTKLDELPQLFNLISGEMSLVGPRPELEEFLLALAPGQRNTLTLRPGLTGWATLHFRHEEELLAKVPQERLREYYTKILLPRKIQLDLEYAGKATFLTDVMILLRTACAIVK